MSQEPSANRDRGVGASSRWDKILDGLFVVLNTALSGPPGWQRAAQSPTPPEKRWKRADFWLSALLCILLTALNAAWLFLTFVVYPYPDPGLNFGWFSSENPMLLYLQLLPILFVLFFLVGILRGRLTGTARSTRRIGVAVCLINTASLFVLPIALGLIIGGEAGLEMFAFLAGGVFLITGFAQGLAGIGGGILVDSSAAVLVWEQPSGGG